MVCKVDGCNNEVVAKGYCHNHYENFRRNGYIKTNNVLRAQVEENGEIWKDVVGYEGLYQVSNLGRVHSVKTNCILRHHNNKLGYAGLILRKNNKSYGQQVHRLVAKAFLPNPNNLPEVNHKDENPRNNCLDNLEWCDKKYNNNYGTKIERKVLHTDYCAQALKTSLAVNQCDKDGKVIRKWASANECKRSLGYDNSRIAHCCRGTQQTAYGYRWEYA